ncbi:helix-turn-helix domain-containing protein [Pseudomonas putida]|uniref:GlxA family transcriptional regulator n=1 Tax=Pseudomonas putida TaxID=303 RepID=UPI0023640164|nr:helix-turn-helix domain-containing protein [Pseudomonas putida]MDD1964594.1 helix-turn-helix domain-containing protein [Pseudomonas putida]
MNVCVIAFNGISPFHLSVPCLVFGKDRRVGDSPWFKLAVCAGEDGVLMTNAGFAIQCDHGLDQVSRADIVVVPSWRDVNARPPDAILDALNAAHARGALVVGLCLGAFVLAHAGLLNGKQATTHWAWAAQLAQDFPQIDVDAKVLYVEQDQVLTSAGVAAGLDCCIHIVRRAYGREIANTLARRLVVSPHREGGQAQFIDQPVPQGASDQRLSLLLDWLRANLGEALSIDQVAQRLAMSRRSFTRHFKQITGSTFGKWLTNERIKAAQQQLETTHDSVEKIATVCGFGTSLSLRQHFSAVVGVSPTSYRKTYRR